MDEMWRVVHVCLDSSPNDVLEMLEMYDLCFKCPVEMCIQNFFHLT
jgi:hypothetical protein